MSDQTKGTRSEKNSPSQATANPAQTRQETEGAFGYQKGKDIEPSPKTDVQNEGQNEDQQTTN